MASVNDKLLKAIELQGAGKLPEATKLFSQIFKSDPNNAAAIYSLGVIALNRGDHAEALRLSKHGIKVAPLFAPMRVVHGAALQAAGRKEEALKCYDEALQIDPKAVDVLINSGVLLRDMLRHHEALERFNRILAINPNHPSGLANCAIILTEFKQSEQAIGMFKRLLEIDPDYDYGLGLLAYERLHICDWTDFEKSSREIIEGVRAGRRACKSLAFMAISDSASDQFKTAQTFASHFCPRRPVSLWQGERYSHDRIRVAYVSPDLREHPVGHAIAGVLERHDKTRFETIAISLGVDDQSRIRARMLAAFDRFIDARAMGTIQIAQLMRDLEVDIAVDLGGYTSDTRTDIFAHRPAPLQVNYLGYPGTMGSDYYDYILADRYVIPPEHHPFYSEKVACLPDAYFPTDAGVKISERTPTRGECGLPETGIVFCSFSHDYKISPPLFDVWMRLLGRVPGSVLWLMARGELAQHNLRKEAELRGIDPSRLVFASRVPLVEDHLARYRQADLFLDTHPYNAHTTAADALMAGLPVITYMGNAFPARVAGSLLNAIGLSELITHSLAEYEALAFELATAPVRLAELKARLAANKGTYPLFDTAGFCRNLEAAYVAMWRRYQDGEAPDALNVSVPGTPKHTGASEPVPESPQALRPEEDDESAVAGNLQYEQSLNTAKELLRQGNLPQAEIYARHCLALAGETPEVSRQLADLRRGYGISDAFELSERSTPKRNPGTRFLLIKAWGYGFWSEVHHLLSQLLLAELTQRTPIVLWGSNCIFRNASDVNAFGHFFEEISLVRLEDVAPGATICPAKWSSNNLYEENLNKWEGENSRVAAQYLFDRPETLLVSDFFSTLSSIIPWIAPSSRYFGLSDDQIYAELSRAYLKPVESIQSKVTEFYATHMQGRPWVAVHVRGSDKVGETPFLAQINEGYFGFIDRILELNPGIGIFLLTDSLPVIEEYKQRYGERVLYTPAFRTASNLGVHHSGHDGVAIGTEVLLDTLLAAKCDYFVGNLESNVSMAIASMRDWPSGFVFLFGGKNVRDENLFLHNRAPQPQEHDPSLDVSLQAEERKKKVLFFNDWHSGDVHMSRPYLVDLMQLLGDCDFYYCHPNNPKLLADIKHLKYTPVKIDAEIMVDTWIGQYHYRQMSAAERISNQSTFMGCNFPSYYAVMRKVYASLNLTEFLKRIEYYLPTIDYSQFDIKNIQRYFATMAKPSVLICNNATMSGQAPDVDFVGIVSALAGNYPAVNFLISNNDGGMPSLPNVIYCTDIIDNPEILCDLNEISYISMHCGLIVGRSSGPYSFSVTKENMQRNGFVCICNSRKDSWFLESSTNISWTDNPSAEHLIPLLSSLVESL